MLIQQAELKGKIIDIRINGRYITEIAPHLSRQETEECFHANGHAIIPSLHDQHIHLNASAAAYTSLFCGPPEVITKQSLLQKLHEQSGSDELRCIGYHESVAGDIDRYWLDKHAPDRPIRLQHRSGRLWIFNSKAIETRPHMTIPDNGQMIDSDNALASNINTKPNVTGLMKTLLSYGISHVTEATPRNLNQDFINMKQMISPLYLQMMGRIDLTSDLDEEKARIGAVKLHYHENHLPSLEDLTHEIDQAHLANRPIASHCVTLSELMLTLAALDMAGCHEGDRIEHAAISTDETIEWMAKLGVTVVTQPHFITERRTAYLQDVSEYEKPHLWRLKSFLKAGINVAAGSDAPFGNLNPWCAMASATQQQKHLVNKQYGVL